MMIEVLLKGDTEHQVVQGYVLSELLARGRVHSFRRSSGWVVVGRDPVRQSAKIIYYGDERRRQRKKSCFSCPEMVGGECNNNSCSEFRFQAKVFSCGDV
jgi:hypothetical protein